MNEDEAVQNVRIELVFSQQVELLQRIAVGMGLKACEAEDVLQDVYLDVSKRAPEFQGTEQAKRWLVRVTANRCISEFRRRDRRKRRVREVLQRWAERKKPQFSPDQWVVRAEETEAVRQGLGQMSKLLRVPLVLKYYCGLNATEIAQILELKPGTVRKRLCDGRIVLAKALLQRGIGP